MYSLLPTVQSGLRCSRVIAFAFDKQWISVASADANAGSSVPGVLLRHIRVSGSPKSEGQPNATGCFGLVLLEPTPISVSGVCIGVEGLGGFGVPTSCCICADAQDVMLGFQAHSKMLLMKTITTTTTTTATTPAAAATRNPAATL